MMPPILESYRGAFSQWLSSERSKSFLNNLGSLGIVKKKTVLWAMMRRVRHDWRKIAISVTTRSARYSHHGETDCQWSRPACHDEDGEHEEESLHDAGERDQTRH